MLRNYIQYFLVVLCKHSFFLPYDKRKKIALLSDIQKKTNKTKKENTVNRYSFVFSFKVNNGKAIIKEIFTLCPSHKELEFAPEDHDFRGQARVTVLRIMWITSLFYMSQIWKAVFSLQ